MSTVSFDTREVYAPKAFRSLDDIQEGQTVYFLTCGYIEKCEILRIVDDKQFEWKPSGVTFSETRYFSDSGLAPYAGGGWNSLNMMFGNPAHALETLGTEEYQRELEEKKEMDKFYDYCDSMRDYDDPTLDHDDAFGAWASDEGYPDDDWDDDPVEEEPVREEDRLIEEYGTDRSCGGTSLGDILARALQERAQLETGS